MSKFISWISFLAIIALAACSGVPTKKASEEVRSRAQSAYAEQESQNSCPDGSFLRGEGLAETPQQAAILAREDIAAQIQSKIETVKTMQKSSHTESGMESLSEDFSSNSKVYSTLENAQDAKIVYSGQVENSYKAVACMSRSDAEKPFLRRAAEQKDSLAMAVAAIQQTSHPLQIRNHFHLAQKSYVQYIDASSFLSDSAMDDEVRNLYETSLAVYQNFKASYGFYFDADEDDLEKAFFARLSAAYPVTGGKCHSGLLLKFNVSDTSCKDGSLGINCSVKVTLDGSSCTGENYFSLDAIVKGSGKYSEDEAKERLLKVMETGDWFSSWKSELDKWKF